MAQEILANDIKRFFFAYFLIIHLFSNDPLEAATIHVCKGCELKSVKLGLQNAKPGDQIVVDSGLYEEGTILVDKPVSIVGKNLPIIDGLHLGHVFYIRANNVSIEGLTIQNSGMSYISDFAGIRAEHSGECSFKNNIFKNNTYSIYFEKVHDCTIENNQIRSNATNEVKAGNGVHLFYSNRISVIGNEITGQRDGLYFEFTEDSLIENNYSHDNIRFGMHFMFSHRNTFNNNTFSDNPTGVAIMYSRHLSVFQNVFERSQGNSSYGFLIKEIVDSKFSHNVFRENTWGIFLNGSNRNVFEQNVFLSNGWAAEIYSNSYNNNFTLNNFIGNNFDVATNSRRNTSLFQKNYWDKYEGYDFDRNGIGDILYRPVNIFSFWVSQFPELAILLNSPIVKFLDIAERYFPVLTPGKLIDENPKVKPIPLDAMQSAGSKGIEKDS